MPPCARPGLVQAIAAPGCPVDIGGGAARIGDEMRVLGVCYQDCRDGIGAGLRRPAFEFVFVPLVLAGDAVAIGGFIEPIGGLALGPVETLDEGAGRYRNHPRRIAARHDRHQQQHAGQNPGKFPVHGYLEFCVSSGGKFTMPGVGVGFVLAQW